MEAVTTTPVRPAAAPAGTVTLTVKVQPAFCTRLQLGCDGAALQPAGEPTTLARPVPPARTNRQMLEAVLAAETEAVQRYTARAKQAEELGDKGLQVQLENMVLDESTHREETERILRDWAL